MNIESLRDLCLSFPGATEDVKWGHDLCFSVGGKMFCVTGLQPPNATSFKVHEDSFELLSRREGCVPAPYMARHKWVMAQHLEVFSDAEWLKIINDSYSLVKEKLPAGVKKSL